MYYRCYATMKFIIYKSAINLSGHWTNRVSILRGGFSNGTASLFCQFDFGAVIDGRLNVVLSWLGVRQILAYLPPFMKTVGGLGNGVKTSSKVSFSMPHSQQSAKMQKQVRHMKRSVDLFPFLTKPNQSDSGKK